MKKDGLLVKEVSAPETMGRTDIILIGKTGTLTNAEFKVA
jgi:magnesium-transporting ATPase (P-type)